MTCDVVTFCAGGVTVPPLAGQTEIASTLSSDVVIAKMIVERLWVGQDSVAIDPLAAVAFIDGLVLSDRGGGVDGFRLL